MKDAADFAARAGHSISWKPTVQKNRNKSKKILNKVILAGVQNLIDFIIGIDYTARLLIEGALKDLIEAATSERTKSILKNAMPETPAKDVDAIRTLIELVEEDDPQGDAEQRAYQKSIQERIVKIDAFCVACKSIRGILEKRLASRNKSGKGKKLN